MSELTAIAAEHGVSEWALRQAMRESHPDASIWEVTRRASELDSGRGPTPCPGYGPYADRCGVLTPRPLCYFCTRTIERETSR